MKGRVGYQGLHLLTTSEQLGIEYNCCWLHTNTILCCWIQ